MLRNAKSMERYALRAHDGMIGHVKDFYFDDHAWGIRYFVVDTGSWLAGRKVLLSPEAIDAPEWDQRVLPVDLTKQQVTDSPGIDSDKPVSRQHEEDLHKHYGWPVYWGADAGLAAPPGIVPILPTTEEELRAADIGNIDRPLQKPARRDPHLRSINDTLGHHIEAVDGEIGHVEDFIIDDTTWTIAYLVVDTRNWWPGKKVIVSPTWIRRVSWSESRLYADLTREEIKGSPAYDPSGSITPDYDAELRAYYGRKHLPTASAQADRDGR